MQAEKSVKSSNDLHHARLPAGCATNMPNLRSAWDRPIPNRKLNNPIKMRKGKKKKKEKKNFPVVTKYEKLEPARTGNSDAKTTDSVG